jgi:hypothetical protein
MSTHPVLAAGDHLVVLEPVQQNIHVKGSDIVAAVHISIKLLQTAQEVIEQACLGTLLR